MSDALFCVKDGRFMPGEGAGSPWSPGHLHGGPPTGLLAHACEAARPDPALQLARLTVDLLRPVPKEPLAAEVSIIRKGGRACMLAASLRTDGIEVARASALYMRPKLVSVPVDNRFPADAPAFPEDAPRKTLATLSGWTNENTPAGLHSTAEAIRVEGGPGTGAGVVWMRLPIPVVAGTETSPVVQAATLADFGNGVGQLHLDPETGCINADVTLHLHREPRPGWLCLAARSAMQDNGIGLVETTLYDTEGSVGRVFQCIVPMATYTGG